jgi:hypothetical protein
MKSLFLVTASLVAGLSMTPAKSAGAAALLPPPACSNATFSGDYIFNYNGTANGVETYTAQGTLNVDGKGTGDADKITIVNGATPVREHDGFTYTVTASTAGANCYVSINAGGGLVIAGYLSAYGNIAAFNINLAGSTIHGTLFRDQGTLGLGLGL